MNDIIEQISELADAGIAKRGFLDLIFGIHKDAAINGAPVVLFGAGELGKELNQTLRNNGITPVCFCDNDASRSGTSYCGMPIISFDQLCNTQKESLIVIACGKEQYLGLIEQQLKQEGFPGDRILCKKSDLGTDLTFMHMYANNGVISPPPPSGVPSPQATLDILRRDEQQVFRVYDLLDDEKSKDLFIAKLALMASNEVYELFKNFMSSFSEPINEFSLAGRHEETEEYFYFNNDVLSLSANEVYCDIGAADGDTVHSFIKACIKNKINYKKIYALEPDPKNFRSLIKNVSMYNHVSCHELGLWSETKALRFRSSDNATHSEAGTLCDDGDIKVNVVSLDDFLDGGEVTYIKMDPPGDIIPEAIRGAQFSISKYKPKLALGACHSIKAIYEIPLLVASICPDYKLYLRHNSCHMYDTVLYATL